MSNTRRQLIVLCDGTNNTLTAGVHDTNVLQMTQILCTSPDPQQLIWYDPGVGSHTAMPGVSPWERVQGVIKRLKGLALGGGVYDNIAEALAFLANNHRESDEIYLFGFSRGAFTARAVAGMLNEYGLPTPNNLHHLPMMIRRYFSSEQSKRNLSSRAIVQQVRLLAGCRQLTVQFVGVWDTVESVGLPLPFFGKKITNAASIEGKNFLHVRHAVALDEYRQPFKPRLYTVSPTGTYTTRHGQAATLKQQAFMGCHTDVGGGYRRSGLSDEALRWMLREAQDCGLRIASPQKFGARVIHSELHTNPLWAAAGQMVRDTRGMTAAPANRMPSMVPDSVWQTHGHLRWPWLLPGLLLAALGYWQLHRIDPGQVMVVWQLSALLSTSDAIRHIPLWSYLAWDGVLMVGLLLTLSTLVSAAFARAAGCRRAGVTPPRVFNLLGLALPLYLAADVLENLLTAWLLDGKVWAHLLSPLHTVLTIASHLKFVGLTGVGVLLLRGLVGK
jgi:uncharacterized protein (DUF2235 family)